MPFLAQLAKEYGGKDVGNVVVCNVDGKRIEAAKCNHEKGCWELTPEGQKLIDKLPMAAVVVDDDAKLQPHQKAAKAKNVNVVAKG